MSEENISIFRQELERVKTQFEDKFQDIMASVRADRENDKRTLQMVNENINNDRKAINQNRALNDKLETLLNVQNTMLSELRSMNNSIKDLSGGGGGMGLMGAALAGLGGAGIASIFGGGGDTNVDGGGGNDPLRNTGGGGDYPNPTRRITGDGPGAARDGDNLFSFISQGEGGYSASNRGTSGNRIVGSTQNTTRNNKNLEDMTFREIMELQNIRNPNDPNRLFAVGAYQIIPSTLAEIFPHSGLDLDDKFTPENQDRLAELLLLGNPETGYTKRPSLAAYLRGESDDIEEAMLDFAKEWASAPDPRTGKSYYGSGNRASHSIEEMRNALLDARRNFEETGSIIPQPQEEEESDAERVEGDITTYSTITGTDDNRVAVGKIPLRPNDNNARMYHPRYSSRHAGEEGKEWADYSQFLYPTWEGGELPEGYSLGPNTRTITDPLTGEERRISFNIIENDGFFTTSGPVIDVDENSPVRISVDSGTNISGQLGGAELPTREQAKAIYDTADTRVEDIVGNTEGNDPRGADPLLESGDEEVAAFDAHLFGEGGPFTRGEATIPEEPVVTPENDVTGGSTRERIRRDQEQEQEETTTFPTLADQFMRDVRGESPTSMTSMDLAPAVEAALAPNLPEPPTEEDSGETPRRTTTTGGGGGSMEQEQPQIESNAIGRFPWAEKIIKYYNLSDMIKTNMLS